MIAYVKMLEVMMAIEENLGLWFIYHEVEKKVSYRSCSSVHL